MTDETAQEVLYITYDGLLEPLGASQVVPYVRELRKRGHAMEILSFEKPADLQRSSAVRALTEELREEGISWTPRTYHKRPSLPATAWDVGAGRRHVRRWARERRRAGRPALVHARGYVAGLMGLAGQAPGARLLFDMRGFWVDERIAGGIWAPDSPQVRIGRWMERRLLDRSDHLVLLTRRGTARLPDLSPSAPKPWSVVPTCVDVERFRPARDVAAAKRAMGLGAGPTLIHIGTVTGWYDGRFTMAVAKAFVERTGGTFVVLTREQDEARTMAAEVGVEARVDFVQPADIPRWLQASDAGLALPRISDSKDASFPTKIAEYLACGMAVLATPIGDVADFADDSCLGLIREAHEIDDAVAWLVSALADPHRGAAARALAVSRLSVSSGADTLDAVYRSLREPGPSA